MMKNADRNWQISAKRRALPPCLAPVTDTQSPECPVVWYGHLSVLPLLYEQQSTTPSITVILLPPSLPPPSLPLPAPHSPIIVLFMCVEKTDTTNCILNRFQIQRKLMSSVVNNGLSKNKS